MFRTTPTFKWSTSKHQNQSAKNTPKGDSLNSLTVLGDLPLKFGPCILMFSVLWFWVLGPSPL